MTDKAISAAQQEGKMKQIERVHEVAWHRNGISGEGFYAIRFRATRNGCGSDEREFLGILFDTPGQCAIICLDLIPASGVAFGANSWRGDNFEPELRRAIKRTDAGRLGPFSVPALG